MPSTDSAKAALHDRKVSPWGPSCAAGIEVNATVQPPLVMESHARRSKCKSPLGEASMKTEDKTMHSGPIGKSPRSATQHQDEGWDHVGAGPRKGERNDSQSLAGADLGVINPRGSRLPKSTVSDCSCNIRSSPVIKLNLLLQTNTPPGDPDEDAHVARTVGCTMAPTKTAERMEAASAQAVKRGHLVTMIEVPDEEDNTAYQQWLANRSPIASPKQHKTALLTPPDSPILTTKTLPNEGVEVTSPMVAMPSVASAKA